MVTYTQPKNTVLISDPRTNPVFNQSNSLCLKLRLSSIYRSYPRYFGGWGGIQDGPTTVAIDVPIICRTESEVELG